MILKLERLVRIKRRIYFPYAFHFVSQFVSSMIGVMDEGPRTMFAAVRSFVSVNPFMNLATRSRYECL